MTDAQNSYIYGKDGRGETSFGYTQMFLRPKLTQNDLHLGAIPDSGTQASAVVPCPVAVRRIGAGAPVLRPPPVKPPR